MLQSKMNENRAMFHSLADSAGDLHDRVDLTLDKAIPLLLTPLHWKKWHSSGSLKITNTGHTAVVTGHWKKGRPCVEGGPFYEPFFLGQIHFHWSTSNSSASEHTLNGRRFPLEMHVLLYNSRYNRPKLALRQRDGIAVLVFFFEIAEKANKNLQPIVDGLLNANRAYDSTALSPDAIKVVPPLQVDYLLYWGSVLTKKCSHTLSWLVCPQPLQASSAQVAEFRNLLNPENQFIQENCCDIQPLLGQKVFVATSNLHTDSDNCSRRCNYDEQIMEQPPSTKRPLRCCLSARVKRRNETGHRKIVSMVASLDSLERLTSIKLNELETLSKMVSRDLVTQASWFKVMEQRIWDLLLQAAQAESGQITPETFQRLQLKNSLFRDITQDDIMIRNSKQCQELFHIKNKPFLKSARNEILCVKGNNEIANDTEIATKLSERNVKNLFLNTEIKTDSTLFWPLQPSATRSTHRSEMQPN